MSDHIKDFESLVAELQIPSELGPILKKMREDAGVTPEELSVKASIPLSEVYGIEVGVAMPSRSTLESWLIQVSPELEMLMAMRIFTSVLRDYQARLEHGPVRQDPREVMELMLYASGIIQLIYEDLLEEHSIKADWHLTETFDFSGEIN
jgi:hypothetical protein